VGVVQPEKGEGYHPWGVIDAEYHVGSANDIRNMVNRENGILYTRHSRTKNSAGDPELTAIRIFFSTERIRCIVGILASRLVAKKAVRSSPFRRDG
jgi:hypothetical protein